MVLLTHSTGVGEVVSDIRHERTLLVQWKLQAPP